MMHVVQIYKNASQQMLCVYNPFLHIFYKVYVVVTLETTVLKYIKGLLFYY